MTDVVDLDSRGKLNPRPHDVMTFVISHDRPHEVGNMKWLFEWDKWIVATEEDARDYAAAGLDESKIEVCYGGLAAQRNYAIITARRAGKWCLQSDDDLRSLHVSTGKKSKPVESGMAEFISEMYHAAVATGAHYAGVLSTHNPFFSSQKIQTWAFIRSGLCMISPETRILFPQHPVYAYKSDWYMTGAQLSTLGDTLQRGGPGLVCRVDWLLAEYLCGSGEHGNSGQTGGLEGTRSIDKDIRSANAVLAEFSEVLKPHSKRPAELAVINRPKKSYADQVYKEVNSG